MCRKEAKEAASHMDEFKAAGATRVVALVKENLENEVQEFREFWPGDSDPEWAPDFLFFCGGGGVGGGVGGSLHNPLKTQKRDTPRFIPRLLLV